MTLRGALEDQNAIFSFGRPGRLEWEILLENQSEIFFIGGPDWEIPLEDQCEIFSFGRPRKPEWKIFLEDQSEIFSFGRPGKPKWGGPFGRSE